MYRLFNKDKRPARLFAAPYSRFVTDYLRLDGDIALVPRAEGAYSNSQVSVTSARTGIVPSAKRSPASSVPPVVMKAFCE